MDGGEAKNVSVYNFAMKERLFVPLSKEPFLDFEVNGKCVEIRKYGRNYTEKTVFSGRRVELRLGYSGNGKLWGNISEVVVGSLDQIFQHFELNMVEPSAVDVNYAIEENIEMLGLSEQYIGFSINFDK